MISPKTIALFFIVAFVSVQAAANETNTSALQWSDAAFTNLTKNVTSALFSTQKLEAIKTGVSSSPFGLTGNQVTKLYDFFFSNSDLLTLTQIIKNNTYGLTCQQLVYILNKFGLSSNKLDVLKSLASSISDKANKQVILNLFYSSSDRNQASQIIDTSNTNNFLGSVANMTNGTYNGIIYQKNETNTSVLQWSDAAFTNLTKNVTSKLFSTQKLEAIKTGINNSPFNLTGNQTIKLYDFFTTSGDVLALTQIIKSNIYGLTCQQIVYILNKISLSSNKLDVLKSLAPSISDKANKQVILNLFYSSSDRNQASQIIDTSNTNIFLGSVANVTNGTYVIYQ